MTGYICVTAVTTIFYLATKAAGASKAKKSIHKLLSLLEVAPVNRAVLEGALESKYDDFEDGVVSEAASMWEPQRSLQEMYGIIGIHQYQPIYPSTS